MKNEELKYRPYFTFYKSYYEAIKEYDIEQRVEFYEAIIEYALFLKPPEFKNNTVKNLFILIKPILDKSNKRYRAGKQGGRPKGKKANQNQNETKSKPNEKQTINYIENDIENDIEREYKEFCKQNPQLKNTDINLSNLKGINFKLLNDKINESNFLKAIPDIITLVKYYKDISNDKYKNYNTNKKVIKNKNYSKEELNSLFTKLEDVEL